MCQLAWDTGCPDICLNVISGVPVRVFLAEINIWICCLSKGDCSPQWRWVSFNLVKAWIEQKAEVKENSLSLPDSFWPGASVFCCASPRTYTTGSSGSPACRRQIGELLGLHNHVNQFFIIHVSLLYIHTNAYMCPLVLCLWGTQTHTVVQALVVPQSPETLTPSTSPRHHLSIEPPAPRWLLSHSHQVCVLGSQKEEGTRRRVFPFFLRRILRSLTWSSIHIDKSCCKKNRKMEMFSRAVPCTKSSYYKDGKSSYYEASATHGHKADAHRMSAKHMKGGSVITEGLSCPVLWRTVDPGTFLGSSKSLSSDLPPCPRHYRQAHHKTSTLPKLIYKCHVKLNYNVNRPF